MKKRKLSQQTAKHRPRMSADIHSESDDDTPGIRTKASAAQKSKKPLRIQLKGATCHSSSIDSNSTYSQSESSDAECEQRKTVSHNVSNTVKRSRYAHFSLHYLSTL